MYSQRAIRLGILIIVAMSALVTVGLVAYSLFVKIACFSLMYFLCLNYSKLELLNPMFWFSTIFYMYGIANSLFKIIFLNIFIVDRLTDIDLSMVALFAFFFSIYINQLVIKNARIKVKLSFIDISTFVTKLFLFIIVAFNVFLIFYLRLNQITTKVQLINTGLLYSLYTNVNVFYYFVFNLYFAQKMKMNKPYLLQLVLLMMLNLLLYYYLGERDLVVFPIISLGLLFGVGRLKHMKIRQFIPLITVGIISMPLLLNLGVRNSSGGAFLNFENIIYRLFSSELITASANVDIILSDTTFTPLGIIIPLSVLVNSIFKFPMLPSLVNFHGILWFNDRYFTNLPKGAGAGYSLIAEGYMFAGVLGVVIWFVFIAMFLYLLYNSISNSTSALSLYCVLAPFIMYSVRGSLETIFITFFRIIVFFVIMHVVDQLLGAFSTTRDA